MIRLVRDSCVDALPLTLQPVQRVALARNISLLKHKNATSALMSISAISSSKEKNGPRSPISGSWVRTEPTQPPRWWTGTPG